MELTNALTLSQVPKQLPHRPNISTVWRWAREGCRGVRLRYIRAGRRILIPADALEEFCEALIQVDRERDAATAPPPAQRPPHRTPAQHERDIAEAERRLGEAGI